MSDIFDPDEIYARSTNRNRTIMSGLSHLHGLYPENNVEILETDSDEAKPPFEIESDTELSPTQVLPLNF